MAARPSTSAARGEPTVTRLRPGDHNPATGRVVPRGRTPGGTPRNPDGSPMTHEDMVQLQADEARAARRPAPASPGAGRRGRGRAGRSRPTWSGRALGQRTLAPMRADTDATGFVLALMLWGWVVLPMLQGGPDAVRVVLRAKFTNKGPDGRWLP